MPFTIPPQIVAAIIGIICAILGYAFREFRNRAKLFFHIVKINGSVTKATDSVQVPVDVINHMEGNFLIKELQPASALSDISERYKFAIKVKEFWPKIEKLIEDLLKQEEKEVIDKLNEMFHLPFFEQMMLNALVLDKLSIDSLAQNAPAKIEIYDDEDHNGSVWICFPERATNFGNNFKVPAIKAKCQPFLEAIKALDKDALFSCFRQVLIIMKQEYQCSLQVENSLSDLIKENSRWVFYCYLANLSKHPVIINNEATLAIRDKKTGKFKEQSYVALYNDEKIDDTDSPIVLRPGADISLCFITQKIQKEMDLGSAIRESYERDQSTCRIGCTIFRIGLVQKQKSWSSKVSFVETAS